MRFFATLAVALTILFVAPQPALSNRVEEVVIVGRKCSPDRRRYSSFEYGPTMWIPHHDDHMGFGEDRPLDWHALADLLRGNELPCRFPNKSNESYSA